MIFSAELTSIGCLVSWTGPLNQGETLSFKVGRSSDSLTERFTATESPGSESITLTEDGDVSAPNLSGKLDVLNASGNTTRSSGCRPLVPGLTSKDVRLLFKLASDHTKSAILRGMSAELYRERSTGTPCTECCDPVSGIQLVSECSTCGGSGVLEGWLGPFPVKVLFMNHFVEDVAPAGGGSLQGTGIEVVRLSAFPRPRPKDRLFIPSSRQIYIIGNPIKPLAGVSGIPAVVEIQARIPDPDTKEAVVPDTW